MRKADKGSTLIVGMQCAKKITFGGIVVLLQTPRAIARRNIKKVKVRDLCRYGFAQQRKHKEGSIVGRRQFSPGINFRAPRHQAWNVISVQFHKQDFLSGLDKPRTVAAQHFFNIWNYIFNHAGSCSTTLHEDAMSSVKGFANCNSSSFGNMMEQ